MASFEEKAVTHPEHYRYNRALLEFAADLEVPVQFRYAKGEDEAVIESRTLSPHTTYVSADGDTYVVGEDPDRENIRSFRLDRIKGKVVLV